GNACESNNDDVDGDGIPNEFDNCPWHDNPGQEDADGDGVGDACDVCPLVADPDQAVNEFGQGLACLGDYDGDGVPDFWDNCIFVKNPDQRDSNGNGIGDACDTTNPNPGLAER